MQSQEYSTPKAIFETKNHGSHIGPIHSVQTLASSEPALNEGGIRWTIFQHKSKLVDAGAIFYVGKKLLIDRDRYVSLLKDGGLAA